MKEQHDAFHPATRRVLAGERVTRREFLLAAQELVWEASQENDRIPATFLWCLLKKSAIASGISCDGMGPGDEVAQICHAATDAISPCGDQCPECEHVYAGPPRHGGFNSSTLVPELSRFLDGPSSPGKPSHRPGSHSLDVSLDAAWSEVRP